MGNGCDQKDCEGNKCGGFRFEVERITEIEKENITEKFLKCDKCGYEQMIMRRTKFLGAIEPYGF